MALGVSKKSRPDWLQMARSRTKSFIPIHRRLNAEMTGEEVIMELEPMLAAILKKMDPAVQPYIDERGRLLVRLDRALESIGFAVNPVDQCVFNRTVNGKQCTVTLEGVLEETGTTGGTASPATASLFIEKSEQKLGKRDAAEFHTVVAKLLYLATRVKDPTQDDKQKLGRVLKYLAATKNQDLHRSGGQRGGCGCALSVDKAETGHQGLH